MKEYKVLVCKEQMNIKNDQVGLNYNNKVRIEVIDEAGVTMGLNLTPTMLSKVNTENLVIEKLRKDYNCLAAEIDTLGIVVENNDDMVKSLYTLIETYVKNNIGPVVWADTNVLAIMTVNKFTKNLLVNKSDKLKAEITVIETDNNDKYLVLLTNSKATQSKLNKIIEELKENNGSKEVNAINS